MSVLQILSDQHAAHLMGCEGHPQVFTPHLDALASQGVRFSRAYAQNPICTPSRICYLSGQYCHNHGYYGLSGPVPGMNGRSPRPSFLGHFRSNGYRTALIGKTHLPDEPTPWCSDDVDVWEEHREYCDWLKLIAPDLAPHEDAGHLPEFPGSQQLEGRPSSLPFDLSVEGWTVQRAIAFMKQANAEGMPFSMQVSFYRPHQCHTPDRRFWDLYPDDLELPRTFRADPSHRPPTFQRSAREFTKGQFWVMEPEELKGDPEAFLRVCRRIWRGHLACITHGDHAVGQLTTFLRESGLEKNTAVVYSSDHGSYTTDFGLPEKAPGICSERVCRVPMIWRIPGIPQGRVCRHFMETVDLAATLPALSGLAPMQSIDGIDLTPLLHGSDVALRHVAVTENVWSKAIRFRQWRLVHYPPGLFDGEDIGELYDIDDDPDELTNLFHDADHQSVVAEGRRLLLNWMITTRRFVNIISRDGSYRLAGDGYSSNAIRDRWHHDWEIANYL